MNLTTEVLLTDNPVNSVNPLELGLSSSVATVQVAASTTAAMSFASPFLTFLARRVQHNRMAESLARQSALMPIA
jgi:hypothetical protein